MVILNTKLPSSLSLSSENRSVDFDKATLESQSQYLLTLQRLGQLWKLKVNIYLFYNYWLAISQNPFLLYPNWKNDMLHPVKRLNNLQKFV